MGLTLRRDIGSRQKIKAVSDMEYLSRSLTGKYRSLIKIHDIELADQSTWHLAHSSSELIKLSKTLSAAGNSTPGRPPLGHFLLA